MKTNDYSRFKFLKQNRDLKEKNVLKIINSIKEWGVIPGRPILVDENFFIVDGQHRFEAIKRLELPLEYEIIAGDIIGKTMALNSNQEQWRIIDYINSYSEQGIDCYRLFLKFKEKHNLSLEICISLTIKRSLTSNDVRKGLLFTIPDDAEYIANFILTMDNLHLRNSKSFAGALITANKKLSKEQMNIIKLNSMKIPKMSNVMDYFVVFENIINYRKRGTNLIKL